MLTQNLPAHVTGRLPTSLRCLLFCSADSLRYSPRCKLLLVPNFSRARPGSGKWTTSKRSSCPLEAERAESEGNLFYLLCTTELTEGKPRLCASAVNRNGEEMHSSFANEQMFENSCSLSLALNSSSGMSPSMFPVP